MDFDESVRYLYSLGNEVEAMKLGLDNIRKLLAALNDPQNNYLKVQIAGTNGKGSVCAFLNSICLEANIKTGVFSSPHLISITERVKIDGCDISEADFAHNASHVREIAERLVASRELETTPTFFEQVTAIALHAFAEAKVELAILETGLGGRLDATTAANAEIAAITRIDLDHQEYLGDTIEEIAAEKAAIIHQGSRVALGEQDIEVKRLLLERCAKFSIEPKLASRFEGGNTTGRECVILSQVETHSLPLVFPPLTLGLKGRHQVENANVAVAVADKLRSRFTISDEYILAGLKNARHPGRLEYQGRYLFDGAHNVGGAKALRDFLNEFEIRPVTIIFGAMKDKDVGRILEILQPKAEYLILTQPKNERALSVTELGEFVTKSFDRERLFPMETVADALAKADEITGENGIILITGSLYLVGEAKKILNNVRQTA
ncbi:MAG: folylpolyglutamate synthase/dihydrofolate synthase family protein [Pyrinomonadaceae bacterium]